MLHVAEFRLRTTPLAVAVSALVALSAADNPKDRPAPGRDLDPVTKEHVLHKVPNFFYYDYPYGPMPGKRIWLRVDDADVATKRQLARWVGLGAGYARSLPPK